MPHVSKINMKEEEEEEEEERPQKHEKERNEKKNEKRYVCLFYFGCAASEPRELKIGHTKWRARPDGRVAGTTEFRNIYSQRSGGGGDDDDGDRDDGQR